MKTLVLDLETKKSFDEVGGAHNKHLLGVSVVGVYDYEADSFRAYREDRFIDLAEALKAAELLVGFNIIAVDLPVLASVLGDWVRGLPSFDLMLEAQKVLGHRVSLDSVAKATLAMTKLGSGLDALDYYAKGDWERLERYCLEDVKLTRDLYDYARKHRSLYFQKGNHRAPIPMRFADAGLSALFETALHEQQLINMRYGAKERTIEVKNFDGIYIKAFCHLRKELLTFRLDRVESAELITSSQPLF
ncbi:MAG: hypothetical protein R2865_00200 [Deinococcales bacterium]